MPNKRPIFYFSRALKFDLKVENEKYDILCKFIRSACSHNVGKQLIKMLRGPKEKWEAVYEKEDEVGDLEE